jgi:hypothetical protein
MKIAELPDGLELYFPDDYDDNKMDEVVIKYLKAQTKHGEDQIEEMRLLRKTIEQGVTKIATIMAAPKELVRDWKDKPIGVKPKL